VDNVHNGNHNLETKEIIDKNNNLIDSSGSAKQGAVGVCRQSEILNDNDSNGNKKQEEGKTFNKGKPKSSIIKKNLLEIWGVRNASKKGSKN
jgi:hypothetical protein